MTDTQNTTAPATFDQDQPTIDKIGFDNFLDDLFGMNIKGLKTIWALLVSPSKYFKAAKTSQWMNLYTPSFRVWFGITALTAASKFIWGAKDSAMRTLYADQMVMLKDAIAQGAQGGKNTLDFSGFDADASAVTMFKWLFIISPFATIFLMSILAFVYRAWGEKLSYVVRLRYVFAVIITGSVVGFLGSFLTLFVSGPLFLTLNNALLVLMALMFFWTAYKGPYAHYARGERFAFSLVLSSLAFAMIMAAIMVSLLLAFIPTSMEIVSQARAGG